MKNILLSMKKDGCDELIDDVYYIDLLNLTEEIFTIFKNKPSSAREELKYIVKRFAKKLQEDGIKAELLVYSSRVGLLYENINLYPDNLDVVYQKLAKQITDITFLLSEYLLTYHYKFKNKPIASFYIKDNNVLIKYIDTPMLLEEQIKLLTKLINELNFGDSRLMEFGGKFALQIHMAYSSFMTRDVDSKEYGKFTAFLHIQKDYELPFDNSFTDAELNKIPHERRYATPTAGVHFEFLDKSKNIDYIEMRENNDKMFFNVYLLNSGGLYKSQIDTKRFDADINPEISFYEEVSLQEITVSKLKLSFVIHKKDLLNAESLKDRVSSISPIQYYSAHDITTLNFFVRLHKTILGCIYLAYYEPTKFKDMVKLRNRQFNKKHGYKKEESYRIAHIRRLPKNSTMSNTAKENAKKEGFDFIPDGYTFVSASNVALEDTQKPKKITI